LAEVLGRPIAAVSLLEAVAVASGARGKVMAVLDAGRGELYVGEYDVTGELAKCLQERILVRDQLEQTLDGSATVTPDANVAELARGAGLKVHEIERPRSDAIARVGWKKILAGDTVSPEALEANYIRRSDAEIFAGPGP